MEIDRRSLLQGTVAAAMAGGTGFVKAAPAGALDEALEKLARTGPEYRGGLANHGPMVAEALVALGREGEIGAWVERYRKRLEPAPAAGPAVDAAAWREALGDLGRFPAWHALFERELRDAPWRDVLGRWAPQLMPGLAAAGAHGLLRTAHAVRALAAVETAPRRAELARGLAYWAARYQALPGEASGAGRLHPAEAIARVPHVGRAAGDGSIVRGLAGLAASPSFPAAADLVESAPDPLVTVSELTATFAGRFLTSGGSGVIALLHGVTGLSAVRLLAPHLPADEARRAVRHAWQLGAGLWAVFGDPDAAQAARGGAGWPALIDRALASGDEHAIKLTEACRREHAADPRPVYLAAAAFGVERLSS